MKKTRLEDIWRDLCYTNSFNGIKYDLDFECRKSNNINAWHEAEQIYAELCIEGER